MTTEQKRRVIIGVIAAIAVVAVVGTVSALFFRKRGVSFDAVTASSAPMIARVSGGMGIAPAMGEAAYDSSYAYEESGMPGKPNIAPMPPIFESGGATAAEVDQKIIKNGSLRLTVDSVSDSLSRLGEIAKRHEGFVQASTASERTDGKHEGYIVIRVPSEKFEQAMGDAKALARIVNNESISGQDVTEQYSDLQARLRNAQAQEAEYLVILKKAVSVEDILRVQQPLGQVRAEIESMQGRLKYLENVTSLSSIDISLTEEATIMAPTKEFRPVTIIKQAVQALVTLAQNTAAAVIWIVIVGGGIAIPVIILVLLVLAALRRNKKPRR